MQLHNDQETGPRYIQQISDEFFATYGLDIFIVGTVVLVGLILLISYYGNDRHAHYINIAGIPIFGIMIGYGYQYGDMIFLSFGIVGLLQTSAELYEYQSSSASN